MQTFLLAITGGLFVACALVSYAADFAYFQREWPSMAAESYKEDRRGAVIVALATLPIAPVWLLCEIYVTRGFRHGLKWK